MAEKKEETIETSHVTAFSYQSPEKIRAISWALAQIIIASLDSFRPTLMVALWRGGAGIGMYMHEYFKRQAGLTVDHTAIRTYSYVAPGEATSKVHIQSLRYLIKHVSKDTHLLIIDDIFDSGRSVQAFLDKMNRKIAPENLPSQIKIATPYWKPENNKTNLKPDYFVESIPGNTWICFPHEISDHTSDAQLAEAMGQSTLDAINAAKNVSLP